MAAITGIKDLAAILKVSPSTISKALSDSPEISRETKSRVRKMAESMGYVPNHYARSLKSKQTKTIGVIVPNVIDDFFAKVLHGIEREASNHGFTVLVTFSNDRKANEIKNLISLVNHCVDGILISFSKGTQKNNDYGTVERVMGHGMPIVMFDRIYHELALDSVSIDDFQGAFKATQHLCNSGCNSIGFLSSISGTSVGRARKRGYRKALKEHGLFNKKPCSIEFGSYRNFKSILAKGMKEYKLDGILAADELSAVYALNTLKQLGYQVPGEISIIGFTDGPMAQSAFPALSVVSQQAEKMGSMAFELLRGRLTKGYGKIQNMVIKPELLLRETTN
ncbi:LacI family DNA-binding transcriptional regulator [Flagellimonas sp. MMG031]|uniref:LacI family DNA-binding transcriptional regulator n=1 Tax=Flagellimonas sp. MMG031 TaxID=3158549 RepID=A0AAU7MWP4_9FLAO